MSLLTDPLKQRTFKGLLSSNVGDLLMRNKDADARLAFARICEQFEVTCIEDIPIDAEPADINLRKIYLEMKWCTLEGKDINELTDSEIREAHRFGLLYVIKHMEQFTREIDLDIAPTETPKLPPLR